MTVPGQIAATILLATVALPISAQKAPTPPEPAAKLVRDVIWNELHDRERNSHWEYLSDRSAAGEDRVTEQVETRRGPVFRLLEMDGSPLSAAQRHREEQRIQNYIHNPGAVAKIQHDHRQDEERLASIMRIMPAAFTYRYLGPPSGNVVRLAFKPNPGFSPSGYEARIVHSLTGTMTVDLDCKRMIDIRGVVSKQIDFGFGLLGHVDKGGTFEVHRTQVSARHWKTDLVDLHIQGRLLMFKTVSKNEREARSGFRPVPEDLTLAQATHLLKRAATDPDVLAELAAMPAPQPATSISDSAAPAAVSSDR